MRQLIMVLLVVLSYSCREEATKVTSVSPRLTAQEIVDRSIAASGGDKYNNSSIAFKFRDAFYTASRNRGDFSLGRIKVEKNDSIIDILSNDGFARFFNNKFQVIPDSMGVKYSASVNSVHYFSILPYGLNDAAVNKKYLGKESLKGNDYYKIQITFDANGGGEDYEDVFIYWIEIKDFKSHYIAYSYAEEDGKGLRFRAAYNERYVQGLRFVDYENFKPKISGVELSQLGKLFEDNQLEQVSKIELENIQVQLLDL